MYFRQGRKNFILTKTEKQRIDFSDAKRFKAEYEAYFSALKYFAFRYIEDEEVVCDLLQDLFVKLWERGEMFENEMVLKAYLYRSVRIIASLISAITAAGSTGWPNMSRKKPKRLLSTG